MRVQATEKILGIIDDEIGIDADAVLKKPFAQAKDFTKQVLGWIESLLFDRDRLSRARRRRRGGRVVSPRESGEPQEQRHKKRQQKPAMQFRAQHLPPVKIPLRIEQPRSFIIKS